MRTGSLDSVCVAGINLLTELPLCAAWVVRSAYVSTKLVHGGGHPSVFLRQKLAIRAGDSEPLSNKPGGTYCLAACWARGTAPHTLGTTIHVGSNRLRVYSVHLESRIANRKHADQLTTVLTDANRYRELPAVIVGDFNTVYFRTEQTFDLLKASDFQTKPYEGSSFRKVLLLRKKLDWIWTRNLEILESGVQGQIEASDHRPVWAQLRWRSEPNTAILR